MKQNNHLLCLGYGYTARTLAPRLIADGLRVTGTTRNPQKAAAMKEAGVNSLIWDSDGAAPRLPEDTSAILISAPPDEPGCPALAAFGTQLAARAGSLKWTGYFSTNGVYGDHGGAWVDENSELRATSPRARQRIKAENEWREFAGAKGLPLVIFRLPGIYGPGRSAIGRVRSGGGKRIYKPGQVFSRMHVDDIAAALEKSLKAPAAGDLFNLADDEPAPPQDVVEFACNLLGVKPPPLIPIEEADLSEMAKSFYADNKRVSNRRMKEKLLPRLAYPTYREGLTAIFEQEEKS